MSIRTLGSGPDFDLANIKSLCDEHTLIINEYLGLPKNDIEEARGLFIKFNDVLRLSHYGKRTTQEVFNSGEYRLLEQSEWQQTFALSDVQMALMNKATRKIHLNIVLSNTTVGGVFHPSLLFGIGDKELH